MSRGVVLVTDPIGGDASVLADALTKRNLAMITPAPDQTWLDLAGQADALIVNLATVRANEFPRLARCRVITRLGVGVNNIDLVEARARGIVVTNVPDYCREEVSDHALALMLSLIRKVTRANGDVQRGLWNQLHYRPIRRLNTLTLGLIGFGRLARALAYKAASLGLRVIAHDPYVDAGPEQQVTLAPLDDVLESSDIVSLHLPITPTTRGLIGGAKLRKMKQGAILINTSRGELVDESALVDAIDSGRLAGAALDVVASEPLAEDSPLRGRPEVILTPHMAFYSEESLIDLQSMAAEDVARILSGQTPKHLAS